jgi:hypothetical protein
VGTRDFRAQSKDVLLPREKPSTEAFFAENAASLAATDRAEEKKNKNRL